MQRLNNIVIVVGAIAGMLAAGLGIAWAMGQDDAARHVWHIVHWLLAFNALKWIAAGCLLALLAVRRLTKSKKRETPTDPGGSAVVRLPGSAPVE